MRGGFSYAALYTRRILVDPGPDPLDAWCLECFLFLFTRGWILVDPDVREEDPVQWITGIKRPGQSVCCIPVSQNVCRGSQSLNRQSESDRQGRLSLL